MSFWIKTSFALPDQLSKRAVLLTGSRIGSLTLGVNFLPAGKVRAIRARSDRGRNIDEAGISKSGNSILDIENKSPSQTDVSLEQIDELLRQPKYP